MPLVFLVERIGVAYLADIRPIELQCGLPCKRLRWFPDAPLAHLIGTPAKRVKEIGAPSLKHPFARVFVAVVATSPLAN